MNFSFYVHVVSDYIYIIVNVQIVYSKLW